MTNRRYFYLCNEQSTAWLKAVVADPPSTIPKLKLLIIKLVLRKRGELD